MKPQKFPVRGAGLGLRRELLKPLSEPLAGAGLDFLEAAPENWMELGGRFARQFRSFTERFPFVTHGLSLSLGSPAPLDVGFVKRVKKFLDAHGIRYYTEHLSYCSDDGHLYDLMPIPFTGEAVDYVAARIRRVQDILEREIAVENVSYYAALGASAGDPREMTPAAALGASAGDPREMTPAAALGASAGDPREMTPAAALGAELGELQFVNEVLQSADCGLLLDVNNVYVNSINHRYDPVEFINGLPAERVRYFHVAGHYAEAEDLRVDTHGADVCDPVWALLDHAYARIGPAPTLLERDFNIPPLPQLMTEIERIKRSQSQHAVKIKVPSPLRGGIGRG